MSIQRKVCIVDKCNSFGRFRYGRYCLTKGLCNKHYLRSLKHGSPTEGHKWMNGQTKHPLYSTYCAMKTRCSYTRHPHYKSYGGRGITVCSRWLGIDGFENFIEDMGERLEGSSLDRIDNNGDYEPSNCRWATRAEQDENKRTNRIVQWKGENYTFAQLIRKLGDPHFDATYRSRLSLGWSVEKIFSTPMKKKNGGRR